MKLNKLLEDVFMDIDWSLYDDETVDLSGLGKKIYSDAMGYTHHPKTKVELIEAIEEELKNGNTDLNCIDTSAITDMSELFDRVDGIYLSEEQQKTLDVSEWDVSNVTDMSCMFFECTNFNQDLSEWDVSNVRDMNYIFRGCENFNQDLSKWKVGKVESMRSMFNGCENFDQNISGWDVSNAINMNCMFCGCTDFNQDLSKWKVDNVRDMEWMFDACTKLEENGLIPDWYKPLSMKTNKLFEDVFMDIDWSLYDDETTDLTGLEKKILDDMHEHYTISYYMSLPNGWRTSFLMPRIIGRNAPVMLNIIKDAESKNMSVFDYFNFFEIDTTGRKTPLYIGIDYNLSKDADIEDDGSIRAAFDKRVTGKKVLVEILLPKQDKYDFSCLFCDMPFIEGLQNVYLGTKQNCVVSMSRMFYGCTKLEYVTPDLTDVCSGVENAKEMFYGCESLRSIPKLGFSDNLSSLHSIFYGTPHLINVPDFYIKPEVLRKEKKFIFPVSSQYGVSPAKYKIPWRTKLK